MLTPEQTALRLRDAEIHRLCQENERLREKLNAVKTAFCELCLEMAKEMGSGHRTELLKLVAEMEDVTY